VEGFAKTTAGFFSPLFKYSLDQRGMRPEEGFTKTTGTVSSSL
jgi:hypothetical protein